jgi:outer membrane protein insertion porin family
LRIIIIAITVSLFLYGEITNIKFNGLNFISSTRAINIIGIKIGDEFDKDKTNIALKELYKLAYFKNISSHYDDGILTFEFIEQKAIGNIIFKHKFENKSKQEIYSMINIKKGDIYSSYKINKAKSLILELLHEENLINSYIEIDEKIDKNFINLTFKVKEGSNIFIDKIFINGNNNFSEDIIKKELLIKAKHPYLSSVIFFDDGKLDFRMLDFDDDKLREFYLQNGYLDAKITKHLVEVDRNNKKASLYVSIDEGMAYKLKGISIFDINDKQNNIVKKYNDLSLEVDEVFNINNFRKDLAYIEKEFKNKGYAKTIISPKLDKKNSNIYLSLIINKQEIYTINDIFIQGNNKTQDTVIRRNLYVVLNDTYNKQDIEDSKISLLRTGMFETVEIKEEFTKNNKIDLIVQVTEKKTAEWIMGGGYSDIDGLFINLSIQDSNTFGSGITTKLSSTLSNNKKKYVFSLDNPMVFDTDYSAGFNVYKRDETNIIYAKESVGFGVNVGKKLNRNTNMYLSLNSDDSVIDSNNSEFNISEKKNYFENSIAMKLKYNSTNRFFDPTRGITYTGSVKLSGGILGGSVDILDISNYLTFHKTLKSYINFDSIVNLKFSIRNVIPLNNEDIPIHKRIFLGGSKNIRGFVHNSIYPTIDNKNIGGTDSFNTSFELSTIIPGQKTFRFVTFVDYGIIGVENKNYIEKSSYGMAIKIGAGMLPIAIYYSKPITYNDNDKLNAVELVIGNTF